MATSSLGMGLDMPDLGFVVHLGAPASPIAYYQQVGRAGRALASAAAVLLPTRAQERIWAYFDSTAFPPEATVRRVLAALDGGSSTLSGLEVESGLRRGRLESLLKVLDVDGVVQRTGDGWAPTGRAWSYDRERYEGIAAARRREQQVIRDYQEARHCLMRTMRAELDDPQLPDADLGCGRCSVCTGELPAPGLAVDQALRTAALRHLRAERVLLEPRKMWPGGAPRRGRIAASARAESGRALARAGDEVWQEAVSATLAQDAPARPEVFDALVATLSDWAGGGWPAGRPTWITWVPSRRHGVLLQDLAERLAQLGRMSVAAPLAADGPGEQSQTRTSAEAATLALTRLRLAGPVPAGPVLLLDDSTRSGFTLTVAAALLREAGAGPVYPLVVCKEF